MQRTERYLIIMGFFNFEKDGPGISKDSPQKKGIFLFFELLFRKIGGFCGINIIYIITSIPMLAVCFFAAQFFVSYLANIIGSASDGVFLLQAYQFVAFIFLLFLGSGPASAALSYFNRAAVREEAVYMFSDFSDRFKANFKQGIIIGIIHPLLAFLMLFGMIFYTIQYLTTGAFFWAIFAIVLFVLFIVFVFAGLYLYQLMITFENSITELYKNAFILSLMNIPYSLLVSLSVIVLSFVIFFTFTPIVSLLLCVIGMTSIMRFALEFRPARCIKRQIIDKMEKESDKA